MRLYSITSTLLLCFSIALLCASQETADALPHLRRPLNESDSLIPDIERRRLFSRAGKDKGKSTEKGRVQTAWDDRGEMIGGGHFGAVYMVKGGFPVDHDGHKRVPAVIKGLEMRTDLDIKWYEFELIYLKGVDQLLAHGLRGGRFRYIVMPYLGKPFEKARLEGFPRLNPAVMHELARELATYYRDTYGIVHMDVKVENMVLEKIEPQPEPESGMFESFVKWVFARLRSQQWDRPELKNWKGYLIDWGVAKFKSQPGTRPYLQDFEPEVIQ